MLTPMMPEFVLDQRLSREADALPPAVLAAPSRAHEPRCQPKQITRDSSPPKDTAKTAVNHACCSCRALESRPALRGLTTRVAKSIVFLHVVARVDVLTRQPCLSRSDRP